MLCKVTHCAGRVSANTRPHQLRWGDREMGTAIICVECSQVAGLVQKVGMTAVFGLGTRLRIRMRTTLENGVLRKGQQPGRAENSFIDQCEL